MPRLVLLLLTLASVAHPAAVIRGTVVENRTGKPLSRTQVVLQPVTGTPGGAQTVRTNRLGGFEFSSLAAGAYIVTATRLGFLPMEYAQKQWNSAGQPIFVGTDEATYLNIRMMRYGGITGTVQDENDVGIPNQDVAVYRTSQPPQFLTKARSDDRGVYRIAGLEPGVFLIRTLGNTDEDMMYIPTFSKETQLVEQARLATVLLDEDTTGVDVRPAAGKLLSISGFTSPDAAATITLASPMGRQTAQGPSFHFEGLPPGPYELYAEAPASAGVPFLAGYTQVSLSQQDIQMELTMQVVRETRFDVTPTLAVPAGSLQILARRKDLAGTGPAAPLKLNRNFAMVPPGRWEVMLTPPANYYVSDFYGNGFNRARTRPDGWNEFTSNASGNGSVRFTLSSGPGAIHGNVKSYTEAAIGAPVYLEAYDPDTHKRLTALRSTRTDLHGAYRFDGLPPGTYRVLSTFEYVMPDTAAMDDASAKSQRVEARSDATCDLDLYGIR